VLKRQRTILGIVLREIGRKRPEATLENSARLSQLDNLLVRAERIRNQRPKDKDKLYALHAPEVECIGKGKARKRYEFGVKVGIAVTHKQGWIWAQGHIRAIPMMDRFYANNWNK
jgi:IS5 family transposase